eukprot:1161723-Pelagomonas_calceolata.AAC.3
MGRALFTSEAAGTQGQPRGPPPAFLPGYTSSLAAGLQSAAAKMWLVHESGYAPALSSSRWKAMLQVST